MNVLALQQVLERFARSCVGSVEVWIAVPCLRRGGFLSRFEGAGVDGLESKEVTFGDSGLVVREVGPPMSVIVCTAKR
jgi:hypothetical protein